MSFVHGGTIIATAKQRGIQVCDLIDMSSNLTPLGAVPGLEAVYYQAFTEVGCLPDASSETLRQVFAATFRCRLDEVIAGNGTTEFIYDLSVKVASSRIVIVNPTYSDYRLGCEYGGKKWQSFTLQPPCFQLSLDELGRELSGGELVFICNPNNPTGTMVNVAALHGLIESRPDVVFVVDESYLPFTREPSLVTLPRLDNLFILCSSSKIYGIPGLRLGFMVSSSTTLASFLGNQKPWVVNRPAQLCGEFLLEHGGGYIAEVVTFLDRIKPEFVNLLSSFNDIEVVAGVTNFILCRLAEPYGVAGLCDALLDKNIMIRNCQSFDHLPDGYFRISLQTEKKNDIFLHALGQYLS